MRLGQAADLLNTHHSRQMGERNKWQSELVRLGEQLSAAQSQLAQFGQRAAGQEQQQQRQQQRLGLGNGGRRGVMKVHNAPMKKTPLWGCNCGIVDNWACRTDCRGCGRRGPRSLASAGRAQSGKPGAARVPPALAPWARAPPAAAAVQDLTGDGDAAMDKHGTSERLAEVRARLVALRPFPDFAVKVKELEAEEKALQQERRDERALPRRLQSAIDTLSDRSDKAAKARAAADEARQSWEAAEQRAQQTEGEKQEAQAALAKVEEEAMQARMATHGSPASAPAALDAEVIKGAFDALISACGVVLPSAESGGAVEMIAKLREAFNARAANAASASAPAGGSVAAAAPGGASVPPAAGSQDAGAGQWRDGTAKRVVAAAARPSGRRGTSPAMASCDSSDGESGRSRSRERKEREHKETESANQATITREIVEGRQRTIGDALARGAA